MTLFKVKKSKKRERKKRTTIDAIHQNKLDEINKTKKMLPKLRKNLNNILKKIEKLNEIGKQQLSDQELENLFSLKDEKDRIEKKINEITDNKVENNYFLDNGHLLFQYYETKNKSSTQKQLPKKKNIEKNSVVDFFSKLKSKKNRETRKN